MVIQANKGDTLSVWIWLIVSLVTFDPALQIKAVQKVPLGIPAPKDWVAQLRYVIFDEVGSPGKNRSCGAWMMHSHWKLPFIVDFPIKNGDFPSLR